MGLSDLRNDVIEDILLIYFLAFWRVFDYLFAILMSIVGIYLNIFRYFIMKINLLKTTLVIGFISVFSSPAFASEEQSVLSPEVMQTRLQANAIVNALLQNSVLQVGNQGSHVARFIPASAQQIFLQHQSFLISQERERIDLALEFLEKKLSALRLQVAETTEPQNKKQRVANKD